MPRLPDADYLRVSEIFGPTFQGEGVSAGQICFFLRLFDCNLTCKWCDTYYTWAYTPERAAKHLSGVQVDRDKEEHLVHVSEVIQKLLELNAPYNGLGIEPILVASGGEPLMQQHGIYAVAKSLHGIMRLHIETAGTIIPNADLDTYVRQYTVSPKLQNSGNPLKKRRKMDVLQWFNEHPHAYFKFVVQCLDDFDEVDLLVHLVKIPAEYVQVMPEGTEPMQILETARLIAQPALDRGYGLTLRTQTLLWGDERER